MNETDPQWIVVLLTTAGEPERAYGPYPDEDACYRAAASLSDSPNDWLPMRLTDHRVGHMDAPLGLS